MLSFQPVTLEHIPLLRSYLSRARTGLCDDTICTTVMWRDFFRTEYAIYQDTLLMKVRQLGGLTAFSMPLGRDVGGCLAAAECHARAAGFPMVVGSVADADLAYLRERYPQLRSTTEPDWDDYIYHAPELAAMPGKRFHGQRNHAAYFQRTWPEHRLEDITPHNLSDVRALFCRLAAKGAKDHPMSREELRKVPEVLSHYEAYGQLGSILYAGAEPVAFAIGEITGDTLFVHIERADTEYRGAYQMIVSGFAARYASGPVCYVNREEDIGDPGLRRSKQSWHPCRLLHKHTVFIEDNC